MAALPNSIEFYLARIYFPYTRAFNATAGAAERRRTLPTLRTLLELLNTGNRA